MEVALPARSSPTVKRRRLAAELRKAREQAELTIEEVAERLEWSSAKISRIENARVSVLPRDVKFLLSTYGLTDRDEIWDPLLGLARESRQKGWWHQHGDAIRDWFEVYVGLEAEAATMSSYHTEFMHGLLQTKDYARAVHRASLPTATDDEIEQLVNVRMERQDVLTSSDGLHLWFILNEAVLRRVVGGHAIMREQLARLAQASLLPNITLQVMPFSGGAHASMDGSFSILGFPDPADPNIVYIEYQTGALYLEKREEVDRYKLIFDHLRAQALPVDASRALIRRSSDEMA
jgi:transcriptional regulator with XRE-family HTH domain